MYKNEGKGIVSDDPQQPVCQHSICFQLANQILFEAFLSCASLENQIPLPDEVGLLAITVWLAQEQQNSMYRVLNTFTKRL